MSAQTVDPVWRHGLSLFGVVKYPPEFAHFDYVNPQAPKGGRARQIALGTFDNFNIVVSGVKGALAAAIELTSDTLLTPALDEVSTQYGLLAESVAYPADFSWAIYRLRPNAKWHDRSRVTAEDVIFSFEAFKQNDPRYAAYYRHVAKLAQTDEHEVTFYFDQPGDREFAQIVGQINVVPKHWWEGSDGAGNKCDITATTLVPPLGSGPYRIKEFVAGRSIVYERVKDYCGRDLNVNVGQIISMSCDLNISATPRLPSRRSKPIRWTGVPKTALKTELPLMIFPPSAMDGSSKRNSLSAAAASCRRLS